MTDEARAKIRETLAFYAYPEKSKYRGEWRHDYPGGIVYEENGDMFCDTGNLAREALSLLADPDDAPRVAHVIRECLVPHITEALGDGELTTRPQSSEKALPPLSEQSLYLAIRTDYAIEAFDNNGETPLNVSDAAEFFRMGYEYARAMLAQGPKGVANMVRDNVRRAQHGTD